MAFLNHPMAIFKAYMAMLPRLEAEQALRAVTIQAIGTGSMKEKDSTRIINGWTEQAAGQAAAPEPRKARFNLGALAAAGVSIQKVKS